MGRMKLLSVEEPLPLHGSRALSLRNQVPSREKVSACERRKEGGSDRADLSTRVVVRALIPLRWGRCVLHAAATERGILALQSPSESKVLFVRRVEKRARLEVGPVDGEQKWHSLLTAYWSALLKGADPGACPPLDLLGSEFERHIWRAICGIPRGMTRTYRELAAAAGRPNAVRAAAAANRRAPAPGFIPTHRVVGADGRLLAPPSDPWSRLREHWAQGERPAKADAGGSE
ncbi:MAG: methylated-DNA--[protein]-cysteine S-methyltransferase [Planctomycetes bacterium]|nr:methylated-DNA--[protein]-cysteine S-methyltransferase [Planctomycetota bacterium]